MILDVVGDVFTVAATLPTPAVAHGVNTKGIMGAGVAKTVKQYWPDMFTEYRSQCVEGLLVPGGLHVWNTSTGGVVFNVASQDDPGPNARLEWIATGITALNSYACQTGLKSVAMVRIGCGIGGLSWENVAPVINICTPDLAVLAVRLP